MYLPDYYQLKTRREGKNGDEFYYGVDWTKDADKKFLNFARAVKYKQMKKLHFTNFDTEESTEILDYLINNCPEKIKLFAFSASTSSGFYNSADYYLKGLEKVKSLK